MKSNLGSIQNQYQAFLFDLWGVVHDGHSAFPGVVPLLNELIASDKKVIFLSNAPRPGSILIQKLIDLGIKATADMMLSSGDVVRKQLIHFNDEIFRNLGKCFYHLGANRNTDILSGLEVSTTNTLEEADFVLLTAYMDEGEDLEQYDEFLKKAKTLKLPFICVNPDKELFNGPKLRYCAGFIAEKYEKMGGTVYYYGKPYPAIYENVLQILKKQGISDKSQVLMVGDTLETDILGARNAGIDSALVLEGNTARLLTMVGIKASDHSKAESYLKQHFEKINLYPNWVLNSIA